MYNLLNQLPSDHVLNQDDDDATEEGLTETVKKMSQAQRAENLKHQMMCIKACSYKPLIEYDETKTLPEGTVLIDDFDFDDYMVLLRHAIEIMVGLQREIKSKNV